MLSRPRRFLVTCVVCIDNATDWEPPLFLVIFSLFSFFLFFRCATLVYGFPVLTNLGTNVCVGRSIKPICIILVSDLWLDFSTAKILKMLCTCAKTGNESIQEYEGVPKVDARWANYVQRAPPPLHTLSHRVRVDIAERAWYVGKDVVQADLHRRLPLAKCVLQSTPALHSLGFASPENDSGGIRLGASVSLRTRKSYPSAFADRRISGGAPHIPCDEGRRDTVGAELLDRLRQELLSPAHDDDTCAMKPWR